MICVDQKIPYPLTAIFYHCQKVDINTTAFTRKPMAYFSIDALTNPILPKFMYLFQFGVFSKYVVLSPIYSHILNLLSCDLSRSDGLCSCSANISDSVLHVIKPSFMKSLLGSLIFCLLKKIEHRPFVFNSCRLPLRCFLTPVIGATIRADRSQFSV